MQDPETGSQRAVEGQLHGRQLGNPKNPVWHRLHWRPMTPGLHWHWPPKDSHSKLSDPSKSHWHGRAPPLNSVVSVKTARRQKSGKDPSTRKLFRPHCAMNSAVKSIRSQLTSVNQ